MYGLLEKNIKKCIALFSDDDYCVALDEVEKFKDMLGAQVHIMHHKGHFTQEDGVTNFKEILSFL